MKDVSEGRHRESKKGTNPDTIVGGFVQECNSIAPRAPRADELSAAGNPHPQPWTKLPRKRKTKLSLLGVSREMLDNGDPRYANALHQANAYRKVRSKELSRIHGHVSSGASSLLASASLALAASRFLYEKFAETGDFDQLKLAAKLADSSRQGELAAWEMSAREGLVMRRLRDAELGMPWLASGDRRSPDGLKKDGTPLLTTGRKTNAERLQRAKEQEGTPTVTATDWLNMGNEVVSVPEVIDAGED